jgi:hypothetical protein
MDNRFQMHGFLRQLPIHAQDQPNTATRPFSRSLVKRQPV